MNYVSSRGLPSSACKPETLPAAPLLKSRTFQNLSRPCGFIRCRNSPLPSNASSRLLYCCPVSALPKLARRVPKHQAPLGLAGGCHCQGILHRGELGTKLVLSKSQNRKDLLHGPLSFNSRECFCSWMARDISLPRTCGHGKAGGYAAAGASEASCGGRWWSPWGGMWPWFLVHRVFDVCGVCSLTSHAKHGFLRGPIVFLPLVDVDGSAGAAFSSPQQRKRSSHFVAPYRGSA